MSHLVWNTDPELLHFGPFAIRWYGALFASAFLVGYAVLSRVFVNEKKPIETLDQLLAYVFIGTLLGARLGHTLFYEPDVYLADPIRILKFWEGGLASHGAATGVFISMWLFKRKHRELSYLWIADRVAIVSASGGSLIRLGNFFNSEIIGKPSNLPWAIEFARIDHVPRHPAMLYESATYLLTFCFLYWLYWKRDAGKRQGLLFGVFLTVVFGMRIVIELVKENQVSFENSLPLNMGQLLSIPMVAIGAWLIVRSRKKT